MTTSYTERAFKALDTQNKGYLVKQEIQSLIEYNGLQDHQMLKDLQKFLDSKFDTQPITFNQFFEFISNNHFIKKIMDDKLVISGFQSFAKRFQNCYQIVKEDKENLYQYGQCAQYIPGLARADPNVWAASFCSVDAQTTSCGESKIKYSGQSMMKVISYAYLYEQIGEEVHKWVGTEPSGMVFNAPVLDSKNHPHNPMINAGAIMVCALLVRENKTIHDLVNFYKQASSTPDIEIDYELAQEEKITAYSNLALLYLMLSKDALPQYGSPYLNLKKAQEALDFYLQMCCILVDCDNLSRLGACFANNGVNPQTGQVILSPKTISSVVPIMVTCGMYNGAGQFAKDIGLPCKSGVAGGILTIIPGIGSMCTLGPKLNDEGNSTKGIAMIKLLSNLYSNFNLFIKDHFKLDLQRKSYTTVILTIIAACNAAANSDIESLQRLMNQKIDLSEGDYDNRTPLHLAAASNNFQIVKLLLDYGVNPSPIDRWGSTPLNDATDKEIIKLLQQSGCKKGEAKLTYHKVPEISIDDDFFRYFFYFRLLYSVYNNDLYMLKLEMINRKDINDFDYDGRTPLSIAASEGHLELVKYLVNHGSNVLHRDARGNTAIDDARLFGHQQVLEFLENYQKQ